MKVPMNVQKLSVSLLWLLGLWGVMGVTSVKAQVGISPLVIEAQVERGQAQGIINVRNTSTQPFRARVYAEPFTYTAEKGFEVLPAETPSNLVPYLQFSPRELEVPPGVERRIRFIVLLPPSLADREYRAILFTEQLTEQPAAGATSQAAITARIGTAVFVRKGDLTPPALEAIAVRWNGEQNQPQIQIVNRGDESARPSATWRLSRQGQEVASSTIPLSIVVEQGERWLPLQLPGDVVLTPGVYQVSGNVLLEDLIVDSFNLELTIP